MRRPMTSSTTRPVGSHVVVGKGLVAGALRTATEIGAEALQVFVGNPRGWALSDGDPAVDEEFRATCAARGVRTFVHTPYLVNLGSPTAATHERSVATIAHNLVRAARIGAEGVGGATRTLDLLTEVAGPGRLRLVHANDSKDPRGSLRDRHERIGDGHIGEGAFTELFAHPATEGVPFVAETPGSGELGSPCLPLLQKLREDAVPQ